MKISEKLDQKQLKEILFHIYEKGHQGKETKVIDMVEDIKSQIILSMYSKPNS